MNILYICHYAGSLEMGTAFRPFYMAREWQKYGHNIRIVGASFSHLRIKILLFKRILSYKRLMEFNISGLKL